MASALRLRLRLPDGQSTCEVSTFGELSSHIDAQLSSNGGWTLLTGYPPAPLLEKPSTDSPLSNFLRSGETLVVKAAAASAAAPAPAPAAPPATAQNLRPPLTHVADEDEEMKLALAMSLAESGGGDGGESTAAAAAASVTQPAAATGGGEERLIRRVVPADNSCLFASVAHAFEGFANRRKRADGLRQVVADAVLADGGVEYSEAVLGQPPDQYVAWILNSEHWGGAIELSILCDFYRSEIAAFDVQTRRVDIFGQGKGYSTRAYLLYDGLHYDLIVKTLFDGAPEDLDVSVFSTDADHLMDEAHLLVADAHTKRKFTDTAKFTLRCLVCQQGLIGEAGAMEHAKKTGHGNFAEYNH